MIETRNETAPRERYASTQPREGSRSVFTGAKGRFSLVAAEGVKLHRLLDAEIYTIATAFIDGDLEVRGDLFAAIEFFRARQRSGARRLLFRLAARLQGMALRLGNRVAARRNIRFHYDRSNQFYRLFLDPNMQYSEADYSDPEASLEEAQIRKLRSICDTLGLGPGDRFLDIGCGWGGLLTYAAEHYGVQATGCSLSRNQLAYAGERIAERGLSDRITLLESDYRDLTGRFDRIASIGMFEHVGLAHMREYFSKVAVLLADGGRFLNRGIVRPEYVTDDSETLFLQKRVFPGGELVHLSDILRNAELAGLHATGMKDLRVDYALTCRAWVHTLQQKQQEAIGLVGAAPYRTWLLYLAASALSFESLHSDDVELVFERAQQQVRPHKLPDASV